MRWVETSVIVVVSRVVSRLGGGPFQAGSVLAGWGRGHSTRPAAKGVSMGKLIATTQATIDGVVDPVGEWVQPGGDHAEYSFERQARSSGLLLGRKTYEGLAGYWP